MSGIVGKKNSTLKKEQVNESKLLTTGVKTVQFWHEASEGETSIPFGSLVMPADVATNGFSNPSSTEIAALQIGFFQDLDVTSSLNGELMIGLTYTLSNSQVKFINGYEAVEGEIFYCRKKNQVVQGVNVVDARPLTATNTLAANTTTFNVGEAFTTNKYPNDQLGEVLVFIDGDIQYRNVDNATADPSADGNYQEVPAANGMGSVIEFNESEPIERNIIVISRNLISERPDLSMMQFIENLGGQLDAVISTVAALAGVDESEFQTAPNQIDLKAFGDAVLANRSDITELQKILDIEILNPTSHQEYSILQSTNALTDRTNEFEFNLGTATITNTGAGLIVATDDPANTRTKFVATKKCTVKGSYSCPTNVNLGTMVTKNGVIQKMGNSFGSGNGNYSHVSINIDLEVGEYFTIGSGSTGRAISGTAPSLVAPADLSFVVTDRTLIKIGDLI